MTETRGPLLKLNDELLAYFDRRYTAYKFTGDVDAERMLHSIMFRAFNVGYDCGCSCGCKNDEGDKK